MKQVSLLRRMTFRGWKESSTGKSLIASNEAGPAGLIERDGNVQITVAHETPANDKLLCMTENGNLILFGHRQGVQYQEVTLIPKKLGTPTRKEGVTSDFFRATKKIGGGKQIVYKLNRYSNSSACVLEVSEEAASAETGATSAEEANV